MEPIFFPRPRPPGGGSASAYLLIDEQFRTPSTGSADNEVDVLLSTYATLIAYRNSFNSPPRYGLSKYGEGWLQPRHQQTKSRIPGAAERPRFIVMMIGNNDRQAIREKASTASSVVAPKASAQSRQIDPLGALLEKSDRDLEQPPSEQGETARTSTNRMRSPHASYGPWDFQTDEWERAYIRRIDATIAAAKSAGVPMIWVGLPSQRGTRASADVSYLNELYRSRAEKLGAAYVDIWEGFVDEGGKFSAQGPDYLGQIRRLRTNDGVYFTKFGARKLARRGLPRTGGTSDGEPQALASVGGGFEHVVKLNSYLTNIETNGTEFREVRGSYFSNKQALPASTLVQVPRLANPAFLLEIEAIAILPPKA